VLSAMLVPGIHPETQKSDIKIDSEEMKKVITFNIMQKKNLTKKK
jgi:hypothetical protein